MRIMDSLKNLFSAKEKCNGLICFKSFPVSQLHPETGMCAKCHESHKRLEKEKTDFENSVESGLIFRPSAKDKQSALFGENLPKTIDWKLINYWRETANVESPLELFNIEKAKPFSFVFVHGETEDTFLGLAFNEKYGVVEFQAWDREIYSYAYTDVNESVQVDESVQLTQCCACCGVGLFTYASRYHMPRKTAMDIFEAMISPSLISQNVLWLPQGDNSYTRPGHG